MFATSLIDDNFAVIALRFCVILHAYDILIIFRFIIVSISVLLFVL